MNDVLIIGCGAIAGGYDEGRDDGVIRTHAKAFSRHPGFRPTACVEPDADRRAAFMAAWGIPEGFASLDEVAHRRFAVACVCGPTATHAEILARLLDMDVAVVLAEKPLTEDTAGAARLVAAYAERGRALAVNYLRRFDPAMTALKHDIASGQLGTLQAAVGYYTKGMLNNAFATSVDQALEDEARSQHIASTTEDLKEALAAFVDKREPSFKGR